jgi:hypothetical protein
MVRCKQKRDQVKLSAALDQASNRYFGGVNGFVAAG